MEKRYYARESESLKLIHVGTLYSICVILFLLAKGSIIIIVATDIPLSSRQLKRVVKRTNPGIVRTGGFTGNGSGEIAIGFSTANKINHYEKNDILNVKVLSEGKINEVFRATSYATEEAILNSLVCSETTIGRDNHKIYSLKDFM